MKLRMTYSQLIIIQPIKNPKFSGFFIQFHATFLYFLHLKNKKK